MQDRHRVLGSNCLQRIISRGLAITTIVFLCVLGVHRESEAQDLSTGSLNVTVEDAQGALIPGATLVLKDLGTGDVHKATSRSTGVSVIPFLNPADYSLTASKAGFSSSQYDKITIQTNQVTNLVVKLSVGAASDTVTVTSDTTPIFDTSGNTLSTTMDMKQVEDLPTGYRDVFSLAFLVPGAVDDNYNNLPGGAVDTSTTGFSTMINRNKSGGFDTEYGSTGPGSSPTTVQRLEDTQEMTVETSELDASGWDRSHGHRVSNQARHQQISWGIVRGLPQ